MEEKIIYLKEVDSTNIFAATLCRNGGKIPSAVVAESQTNGSGRMGRKFFSPHNDGIYMTYILNTENVETLNLITSSAGLAVSETLEEICGIETQIKWPNDVVLNKKKVCGILTEMNLKGTVIDSVIVGIGINVHQNHFPEELKEMATSLDIETGGYCSRSSLIEHTLRYFEIYYEKYLQTGDCTLLQQEYENYLANKEELVKVLDPAGAYEGIAKGITPKGELMVDVGSTLRYVDSGEVSVRGIYGYV